MGIIFIKPIISSTPTPTPTPIPLTVNATPLPVTISTTDTLEIFQFTAASDGTYDIVTTGSTLLDTFMYLYGPDSLTKFITWDNDSGTSKSAAILKQLT